ncbi:MAG TPA: 50S ribosomal protein L33 [Thermotogota bacterium]|nr:50S ribosomal protein L33 [Thermotogota bacterium]NLH18742.1 50S ribosomal protein L33 [Thermotogaceae bacterium]HNW45840.1 50S ribosomal protein L33 [Thermotogota bacterium]HNY82598.1 50S ribosomal protein L33 [Thermotogota bacterium]HOD90585.1 50S ribosomal protein L33 [Thermotogota bacterium]
MRVKITLECTECKDRNYSTTKNKQISKDKLSLNKYCKRCRKHTLHREGK